MVQHRGGRDSSVSSAGGEEKLPVVGSIIKGEVSRVTDFGAFVQISGFTDGLVHVTRIDESGRRLFTANDVRKRFSEGQQIFAKVLKVETGKVVLDYRFVDQDTGTDTDPHNWRRAELDGDKNGGTDKFGDAKKGLPELHSVHEGTVHSLTKFGAFLTLGDGNRFKHGLLPSTKMTRQNLRIGDTLHVKVVEVLDGKFNLDMRYVDQRSGADLDPQNIHSNEKIVNSNVVKENRNRSRSTSVIRRHRRSRSRSAESIVRRPRHRSRSRDNRRTRSPKGRSFYGTGAKRTQSPDIIRRR